LRPQRISCAKVALDVPLARLFDYRRAERDEGANRRSRDGALSCARQRVGVVVAAQAASEVPAGKIEIDSACATTRPRLSADWLELVTFLAAYYQRRWAKR